MAVSHRFCTIVRVLVAGTLVSLITGIALLWMTDDSARKTTRCLSAMGCDITFPAPVRPAPSDVHQLQFNSSVQEQEMAKAFAELEAIYQKEISKMSSQIEKLRKELRSYDALRADRFDHNNCSSLLVEDGRVRNCISGDVIGRIPGDVKTTPFEVPPGGSPETGQQRADSFQKVFANRAWGHDWDTQHKGLNASGMGATLYWTQETIATLNIVISDIKRDLGLTRVRVLDVPCGDMAWMSRFLKTRNDIEYTGMDIVPAIITNHKHAYKNFPWKFQLRDIVKSPLNESYDLILCRTLLQHLFYQDAMRVLQSFSQNGSKYLLLTTWARNPENEDLSIGDWNPGRMRRLNVELPPVTLTPPRCLIRDGPPDAIEGWDHFLGLWKLPLQQVKGCQDVKHSVLPKISVEVYSCVDWLIKDFANEFI